MMLNERGFPMYSEDRRKFKGRELKLTKTNNWQTKGCISEVNFGYTTVLEGYPQLTADINKLGDIAGG